MKTSLKARHFELTDHVRNEVERKLRRLDRITHETAEAEVELIAKASHDADSALVAEVTLWNNPDVVRSTAAGATPIASFATLPAENNFPRLPVWQNRAVHVALLRNTAALPALPPDLRAWLRAEPEVIRLDPTAKSMLR